MTAINFSWRGVDKIDADLRHRSAWARDQSPAFNHIANRFVQLERQHFATEGAFTGARFSPLSPAYRRWKIRMVGSRPILQLHRGLARSLTRRPLGVERIGRHTLRLGTDDRTARFHQHGKPRRPPIRVPLSERRMWVRVVARFLETGRS